LILFLATFFGDKEIQMHRFKTAIGIFLIFACGMAAGVASTLFYVNARVDRFTTSGPAVARLLMRPDIARELELTDAQREKIMAISARIEQNIQSFKQAHHPELIDIIDSGLNEINRLLDADQQARFTRIHAKMKQRWEKGRCAPGRTSSRPPPVLRMDSLAERLDLNAEQFEKIQPIVNALLQRYQQLRDAIKERNCRPGHPLRAEIRAIEGEAASRIHPLLNPAQQQALESITAETDRHGRFRNQPLP
jgi:hypothetical protein